MYLVEISHGNPVKTKKEKMENQVFLVAFSAKKYG